ncbi:MAG: hypothetical protein GXO60_03175 [Epsilonproteobacteria bacterium]|nr:hypothetical protein [Campylobacterota bacterium]
MKTRTFFFNESSKKGNIKKTLGDSAKELEEYIETITKMKSGNKIGYFQFQYQDTYYKFYIMPKIYRVEEQECDNCIAYQQQFINFFKHYYRLVAKYNIDKYSDELGGNISDSSYRSKDSVKELASDDLNDVDDFIVHNYNDALSVIESFFIKHKKQLLIEQKFQSQSIKNKLDIRRNIVEPNKSNVHQTKKLPMIYSNIAVIAMEVLSYFVNVKIKNFSDTDKSRVLQRKVNKIQNSLNQKFSNSYDLSFKIKEILLRKTSKLFDKNNEYGLLYKALLKLSGKEHYYNGSVYREIVKEDKMISLFFQPEKLYEWIVYDKLVESREFDKVLKDGKDDIKLPFQLEPAYDENKTYSSEPDLVIIKDGKKYPIDAKWKVLKTKNASFDNDIAKLRRDAKIRGVNKGYLIYPKIDENSKFQLNTEYKYDFDDFVFELRVVNTIKVY